MKFSRGFTLVELLMGLAILSIVTTTVVPSFSQLLAEQRLRQVSNELRMSLTLARSEAIKRHQTVNVLPAESVWSDGWCVESDTAASCTNSSLGAYVVPNSIAVTASSGNASLAFNSWGRTANCPKFELETPGSGGTCSCLLYTSDAADE